MRTITIALTGASGMPYAINLLEKLIKADVTIYLLISKAAQVVLAMETDIKLNGSNELIDKTLTDYFQAKAGQIKVFSNNEWTAPIASGSNITEAMVIIPCTMNTLAAIANGLADNLIHRSADVTIKEQKKLILVPRETPYSAIHLKNMLKLAKTGVLILDANPGFYHQPKTINDLVDFIVARILEHLNIKQNLIKPWGLDK